MNEKEQAIFDIIMKHMRINGSEDCSTSEFESDVEDAAKEIAAQHSAHPTPPKQDENPATWVIDPNNITPPAISG